MANHTPTPWNVGSDVTGDIFIYAVVLDENGEQRWVKVAEICKRNEQLTKEQARANADYIVECVNAHNTPRGEGH